MLPNFIIFTLGHLFIEKYQEAIYNHVKITKKKLKENVDFYKVLYPIIWNSKSSMENKAFVICFVLVCLESILNKLELFVDKEITNSLSKSSDSSFVVPWGFLILSSMMKMASQSLSVGKRQHFDKAGKKLSDRLQIEAFSKVHEMSIRWNIEKGIGEINSIVSSGSYSLWSIIRTCFGMMDTVVSAMFSFYYVSTRYSFWMGIFILALAAIDSLAMHLFRKWSKAMRDKQVKAQDDTFGRSMESLANFQTVKNFACEDNERRRFRKLKEEQTNSGNELKGWSDLFSFGNYSYSTLISLGVTLYGANQLSQKQISYGDYVLLSSLFFDLYYSLKWIYDDVLHGILSSCEALNKTVSLLNETPEITDKKNAIDINLNDGRIELKNVTFSYATINKKSSESDSNNSKMEESALDDNISKINRNDDVTKKDSLPGDITDKAPAIVDVSFAVEAGQCLALVGPSGSGKSTIAKLIMRMYNVDEGEICIDHQEINKVTFKSLRSSIGVVPQEVELFNDTVANNIKYSRQDASDEEVQEAAMKAEIHEKINNMDDMYQTKVGNKGLKLSGGERQRIGIARVFLNKTKGLKLHRHLNSISSIMNFQCIFNILSASQEF